MREIGICAELGKATRVSIVSSDPKTGKMIGDLVTKNRVNGSTTEVSIDLDADMISVFLDKPCD